MWSTGDVGVVGVVVAALVLLVLCVVSPSLSVGGIDSTCITHV